ncbi:MAG: prepilin-type N-terminal cleavage/methylation domain-containing protein [Planctomycetia bacterium]|nr:prepilin-type N-terminal cleavage/methylation domain-containing protein [Planctomycetia bacterium]
MKTLAPHSPAARRDAFTLIELLVVIFIMLVITAIVIKMATPDTEARQLRESARQVAGFIAMARTRAIETGRPAGFRIETDLQGTSGALFFGRTIYAVEVPPPYAGDTINRSYATVTGNQPVGSVADPAFITVADVAWQNQVRRGDLIQFNNQGHQYIIAGSVPTGADAQGFLRDSTWVVRPLDTTNGLRNPGVAITYRVTRQPIKSTVTPLELPEGFVVDLSMSGFGPTGTQFRSIFGVTVIFSPNGSVLSVADGSTGGLLVPPNGPVFFLVGTQAGLVRTPLSGPAPPPPLDPAQYNLGSHKTFWVGVNHQTGLVAPVENIGGPNYDAGSSTYLLMGDGPAFNRGRFNAVRMRLIGGR